MNNKERQPHSFNLPSEGESVYKKLQVEHVPSANHNAGNVVIDHENVDYRHNPIAGTGPGGIDTPQGPDLI